MPLIWDRKDLDFKELKLEKGAGCDALSTTALAPPLTCPIKNPTVSRPLSPAIGHGLKTRVLEFHRLNMAEVGEDKSTERIKTLPCISPSSGSSDFSRQQQDPLIPVIFHDTGHRRKPLKWSYNSFSSSSKILDENPARSPLMSPPISGEDPPRKKQRLGWGQGLAKYEKKKVYGSSDLNGSNNSNPVSDVVVVFTTSPATLSCMVSSSSPGIEGNPCDKEANKDAHHLDNSAGPEVQKCSNELSVNLYPLEASTISVLTSLIGDLLQPDDACSGDSFSTRYTVLNKLLALKEDISKELVKTEFEIDLHENKLKSLNVAGISDPCRSPFPCLKFADVASVTPAGELLVHTNPLEEHESIDVFDDCPEPLASGCGKSALLNGISTYDSPELTCSIDVGEAPADICGNGHNTYLKEDNTSLSVYCGISSGGKGGHNHLLEIIMTSNKTAAEEASQVFAKALAADPPQVDIWGLDYITSCRRNDNHVKERLSVRKHLLRFKERVLTLKYRAFQHLWKEQLSLHSMGKHRPKSHSFALSCRALQSGPQRRRSSCRSRFTVPGNLNLVPTTQIIDFTSKFLSDYQIKLYRNNLKLPALILDEKDRRFSRFLTYNGLIENPPAVEKEKAMINPWTKEEKEVFLEKLAAIGKDFTKISSFLHHKTTADCIEFYYKNHKSESFREVKKMLTLKKMSQCLPTSTYLNTSGKRWNHKVNASSLDMLGAASALAAQDTSYRKNRQKSERKSILGRYYGLNVSHGSCSTLETVRERETSAADVLAGICSAPSSEEMSSCVTTTIDPSEKLNYVAMDRSLTAEIPQSIDEEDTCSDDADGELDSSDWTDKEKSVFVEGLSMYGKDFAKISFFVRTRSTEQCKIFFSKARKCLHLDVILLGPSSGHTTMSETNPDGGRSDTDDACAPVMDSAICSTQSCSKVDAEVSHFGANAGSGGFNHAGNTQEQYEEVRGSNQEDAEAKIDDKVAEVVEMSHSNRIPKEVNDDELRCNKLLRSHEIAEDSVDIETSGCGNELISTASNLVTTECADLEQLKSHDADDGLKSEACLTEIPLPESGFVRRQKIKVDRDAGNSFPLCFAQNKDVDEDGSDHRAKLITSHTRPFAINYQHHIAMEPLPSLQEKLHVTPLKHESSTVPSNRVLRVPSSISFTGHHHLPSQSVLNPEQGSKWLHRDFCKHYSVGRNLSMHQVNQALPILRGYPLRGLNHKEVKGEADLVDEQPVIPLPPVEISKGNGISDTNQSIAWDCFGSSFPSHLTSWSPCYPSSENQPVMQLRACSQSSCGETETETERQPHRTGDVKLFGKILSNTSIASPELDGPKFKSSPEVKAANICKNGAIYASRPGSSSGSAPSCLEDPLPLRSYGFWDGNRIQIGYSSLPESAFMLAKYQANASFYTGKGNNQQWNLGGIPVRSRADPSSGSEAA